jgi:phosphoglycerate dehydrogenase-like enzyme
MVPPLPRLLIALPPSARLVSLVSHLLPNVPYEFVSAASTGPWPEVEALLTGAPDVDIPQWQAALSPQLKLVQTIFAGVDTFPFSRFPARIMVAGNVGAFAPFVSEHAVALVLALAKNLVPDYERVRQGLLRPSSPVVNLTGRTALLLGFGETARLSAIRLRPFGVRIEGISRSGTPSEQADRMYPATELGNALATADVIVDFRPLTSASRATINGPALQLTKEDAIYVNVGRAGTVDEEALYRHLVAHPRFRAATDVWWQEDPTRGTLSHRFPFIELPNFLGTPHSAGYDREMDPRAQSYVFQRAIENITRFFGGERPRFLADRAEYQLLS